MPPTETAPAPAETQISDDAAMKIAMDADNGIAPQTAKPATDGKPAAAPQDKNGTSAEQDDSAKKPGANAAAATDKANEPGDKNGQESDYSKAGKDAKRRDDSWKKLDQEKQEFRTEKAAFQNEVGQLRREVAELRKRNAAPAGPIKDEAGHTADTYEALAKKYANEGNDEMHQLAKSKAEALRAKAQQQQSAPAGDPSSTPEFAQEWERNKAEMVAQDKTLNDPENPVVKAANSLLNDKVYGRFFRSHPDGIKAAVEVAQLMRASAESAQLKESLKTAEAETKKHKAEVDRLNGLLQPRGSHPSGPPAGEKKLEDMSAAEADAHALRVATAADRGERN